MKGLELSRRFFLEVGMPALHRDFEPRLERIAAGLVGPGSECWGYDDELSRDHDWGPGFCLWLEPGDYQSWGADLAEAYAALPVEFMGHGPRRVLPGEQGRVGAIDLAEFFQRYTGLDRPPRALAEWRRIPPGNLAVVTNGEVFRDPLGSFSAWREALASGYPEDLRLKHIAAKCMSAGQSGQYNFLRSYKRGEVFAWHQAQSRFCQEVLELGFWLNRRYPLYYKWLHRAAAKLPILGAELKGAVAKLLASTDLREKVDTVEGLAAKLIEELQAQGLSQSRSDFLLDHGPEVQGRISDAALREDFRAGA